MVTLYKPNKSVKGVLASFKMVRDDKDTCVLLELVRQSGWDDSKKTGSFKWPEDKRAQNKKIIKLNIFELGSIVKGFSNYLEDFEGNKISLFHKFGDTSTSINVTRYEKGKDRNFSFSVKEGSSQFGLGITMGEAQVISEFFSIVIREALWQQTEKENANRNQNNGGGGNNRPEPKEEPDENTEDAGVGNDMDEDIPF